MRSSLHVYIFMGHVFFFYTRNYFEESGWKKVEYKYLATQAGGVL